MRANFTGSQSVSILVPQAAVPIQHYLRQPHRLMSALAEQNQVESLGAGGYRLKMKPRQFFMFSLQPTVDIQVQAKADGTVLLTSQSCEIRGVDFINHRFQLNLKGILSPVLKGNQTYLEGQADLQVQVDLPPMLWMTPNAILQAAGNGLIKSILITIRQKLAHQLILDYQAWAQSEAETGLTSPSIVHSQALRNA
ncbi:MAG: DUF1997 domain-containing protein [Thermosynechococcaceae cyanobacterium MS004]|nr:DUF1997 domain-containing protein [Thermosynechococcaceae cyanobacterium MS004]